MTKTKKMLAVMLAGLMVLNPMTMAAQTLTTPTLQQNQTGAEGITVFEGQLAEGTWGVQISDFTDGMNQVNLAILFDGNVSEYRIAARSESVFRFTVPAGVSNVSVVASTNHTNQGSFTLNVLPQVVGTDSFVAGTYTGTATNGGHYYIIGQNAEPGNVQVAVAVSDTEILDIQIVEHHDTQAWFNRANPAMIDAILLAQSTDVDMVTSATNSSTGILEAVTAALEAARAGEGAGYAAVEAPAFEMPALEDVQPVEMPTFPVVGAGSLPMATATFTPGTQTVTAEGWNPMTVEVTFGENQIVDISVVEHNESFYGSGWALRTFTAVPDQILVHQSTQAIDSFNIPDVATGATETRNAIIEAVEEAITLAGANPADLTPQITDTPLAGDRFVPGFAHIVVPAGGEMLHSDDVDMNILVSFGRNEFHLWGGNTTNANKAQLGFNGSHGESAYSTLAADIDNPDVAGPISGGTWGGWFFRQVVNHQINDRQSTQGIDVNTGATLSASGIVYGVEQAMLQQGANPADISPILPATSQLTRNPSAEPTVPFFNAGIYTVTVDGFVGPIEVIVTLDRTLIRRIQVTHNETESIWTTAANNELRDAIFAAQAGGLGDVDTISGATVTSQAIIDAVQQVVDQAWIN